MPPWVWRVASVGVCGGCRFCAVVFVAEGSQVAAVVSSEAEWALVVYVVHVGGSACAVGDCAPWVFGDVGLAVLLPSPVVSALCCGGSVVWLFDCVVWASCAALDHFGAAYVAAYLPLIRSRHGPHPFLGQVQSPASDGTTYRLPQCSHTYLSLIDTFDG